MPIVSPQFGHVMAVCVGAMMVGSIKTTVEEGDTVKRGQEFGYFAFGESCLLILILVVVVEGDLWADERFYIEVDRRLWCCLKRAWLSGMRIC